MKKVAAPLLFLLLLQLALAQAPQRVVVLPFDATQSAQAYSLGLSTGLQRTLNSLDGIYSPSVAEAALFTNRANEAGLDGIAQAIRAFEADYLITGAVSGSGSDLQVTLVVMNAGSGETTQQTLSVASDPGRALEATTTHVAAELGRTDAATGHRISGLASEAPQLVNLMAVASASSRLGGSLADLASAAQIDSDSSWVLSEYARALALAGRTDEAAQVAREAAQLNQNDAEAHAVLGIVAQTLGDDELARSSFERAVAINSHHAVALTGLASMLEDRAQVEEHLRAAVAAAPRLEEAVIGLANLESSPARALQSLRRAARNLPESVSLHRAFVRRALAAGDTAGAVSYLREGGQDPLTASPALYSLATLLPEEARDQALQLVREGRERFPESLGLQVTEAQLLQESGQTDEAIALYRSVLDENPENVDVANNLAVLLAQSGRLDEAQEVFESLAGENDTVSLNLARLLLHSGEAQQALSLLEELVARHPADSEALGLLGIAQGRTGSLQAGIGSLEAALQLNPDNAEAGNALEVLRQQQAIVGESAVTLEGDAAREFELGLGALESGNLNQAREHFSAAAESGQDGLLNFYYAYTLQLTGQARQAALQYELAREQYPENDTILNNLGYAYLQVSRFDKALDVLRSARSLDSSNPSVHVNLGLTYFGLGRFSDALAEWDIALELDPGLEPELRSVREQAMNVVGR